MPTQAVLFNIQRRLGTAADRCQQSREERDQLGPIDPEGPSVGAIFVSIIGILTIPAAVLADYHLLAAPVAYICQLSGAAETTAARILVPVALTLINVAASINRAQQTVLDGTYSEYEPQTGPRNPIIAIILLLQVAAAVAQYIALQAVNPAPANAVILLLLGAMAVVTHMAVYLMAGNGILLLAKASNQSLRATRHRRLSNALRTQRRALFRHYQVWNAALHDYRQANPGAPAPELDPVIASEINIAIGAPPPTPQAPTTPQPPPAAPTAPPPGEPPNPYQQVNPDDQRI